MRSTAPITLRNVPPIYRARIRATRCCICRRPRGAEHAFRSLTCARDICAQTYKRLHARRRSEAVVLPLPPVGLPACSVCDWPLTPPELDRAGMWSHVMRERGICSDSGCRRKWSERRKAETEAAARDARLLAEKVAGQRDAAARDRGIADPESYDVVRIPANARRLVNLPEHRRRLFRDYLYELISAAVLPREGEPEAPAPAVHPAALPGVVSACTLCRGNCCFTGFDHAHLRVEDIRRHMEAHPEQRPRDVHAAFMARIGRRAYEDSCLFHGKRGCELGELRGLTCRRHFCQGLFDYTRDVGYGESARACFVSLGPGTAPHYLPGQEPTSATPIVGLAFTEDGRQNAADEESPS